MDPRLRGDDRGRGDDKEGQQKGEGMTEKREEEIKL